mgnify:CR=1 FL=1
MRPSEALINPFLCFPKSRQIQLKHLQPGNLDEFIQPSPFRHYTRILLVPFDPCSQGLQTFHTTDDSPRTLPARPVTGRGSLFEVVRRREPEIE